MKISIGSDLHLEFGLLDVTNDEGSDVLILAGDIIVARLLEPDERMRPFLIEWFEDTCALYQQVIMIAGNHEHYDGNYKRTVPFIQSQLEHIPNLHILENQVFEYNGVRFLAGTAWTNMNRDNPLAKIHVRDRMNDFQLIRNYDPVLDDPESMGDPALEGLGRSQRFTTDMAVIEHNRYMDFVEENLQPGMRNVLISHHPLSMQFVHPKYRHEPLMNYGYCSDHDDLFHNHPEIALYVCGHCHHAQRIQIGETQCVLNPRGYIGHEDTAYDFKFKTVEI